MIKIRPNEVAFDIDGVFADTIGAFIREAKEKFGININYNDIKDYELRKAVNMDESILIELANRILYEPLEMGIQPIKGSIQVLKRLAKTSRLFFVTARPDKEGIKKWILTQLRDIDKNTISVIATGTHEEKVPLLLKEGIKYFVEDRLETCFLLEKHSITPIVFEQPWNSKPHPFLKVKNWQELENLIKWN
jgi:uncharacterized HAD superfamily protein